MAGVKAKKNGGPRKEPRFIVSPCAGCSSPISQLRDAYRVRWISYTTGKRRSGMTWQHRTCVGTK